MPVRDIETVEKDRRRFLELAGKLGLAAVPVMTLVLAKPDYAAASGINGHVDAGRGNGSFPTVIDLDPGKSGGVNQGGD